jgi:hypothetical protein
MQLSHYYLILALLRWKIKRYKSPGSHQILAETIQEEGEILWSEIHKLINSIWNKEELPDQWKESTIVPIHKGDKTDCSNYLWISLLSTSYIMLFIIFSRWSLYIDEIIWDHQCGFQHNRSTIDQILFAFFIYWWKNGCIIRQYINYSLTSRKSMIHLGREYCIIFS